MNTTFRDAALTSVEKEFRSVLAPASIGLDEVSRAFCFLRDAEDEAPRHDRAEPVSGNVEDALIECIDGGISPTVALLASSRQHEEAAFRKLENEMVRGCDGCSAYARLAAIVDDELDRHIDGFPFPPHHDREWVLLAMRQLNLSDSLRELESELRKVGELIAAGADLEVGEDDPPPAGIVGISKSRVPENYWYYRFRAEPRSFKDATKAPRQYMRHKRTRQLGSIRDPRFMLSVEGRPSSGDLYDEFYAREMEEIHSRCAA